MFIYHKLTCKSLVCYDNFPLFILITVYLNYFSSCSKTLIEITSFLLLPVYFT